MDVLERIDGQVKNNAVVIYMKGSPDAPACGFSARAAATLASTGVEFAYVNVLTDPEIFENLPKYANWPTFPQIYIGGELAGGGDIIVEMAEKGELKGVLEEAVENAKSQQQT
jgi:monothiol glutaredoxin